MRCLKLRRSLAAGRFAEIFAPIFRAQTKIQKPQKRKAINQQQQKPQQAVSAFSLRRIFDSGAGCQPRREWFLRFGQFLPDKTRFGF